MTLKQKLRDLIEQGGRGTSARLAEYLKVPPVYITRYASDDYMDNNLPSKYFVKTANFFGVEATYFLELENPKMKLNTALIKQILQDRGLFVKDLVTLLEGKGFAVTINTIKSWTRTNDPRFPAMPKLLAIAEILEVNYQSLIINFPMQEKGKKEDATSTPNKVSNITLLLKKIEKVDKKMEKLLQENLSLKKEIEQLKIGLKEAIKE